MKHPLRSALVIASCLTSLPIAAPAQSVKVGDVAPDFTVANHATGARLRMSDFAGKVLVLEFFTPWSVPCQTASQQAERDIQQYYAARGGNLASVPVQVLPIGIDPADQAATDTFIRTAGLGLVADDVSLFTKSDQSLWGMGRNGAGQLGDGTSTNRLTPVPLTAGVCGIAAGSDHCLFVKPDGTLRAMGYNSSGQLGDGTTTTRYRPVQVATGVCAVAAGYAHSAFFKADGSLWTVGFNDRGALGDGTTVNRYSPVRVAENVAAVAAGQGFTLYLTQPGWRLAPPQISVQPVAQGAAAGGSVIFTVNASSSGPLAYQWRKDGTAIAAGTLATLSLRDLGPDALGRYDVVVANAAGAITSRAVALTLGVNRIANLSVRTTLDRDQTLTVGFVTSGSKQLLARAVGPSLYSVAGLTAFLPDPRLVLVNQSTGAVVAQNDNWDASLATLCASLGAFPMDTGSKDGALLYPVNGGHTAQISGTGSGIVLVEVYDAEGTSAARLTNVSARNQVGTGDNILIAGFVIDGTGWKTLLIRGIGPALRDLFGVAGALADPKLEVLKPDGSKLAENDNWETALTPAFDQVGAFRFPDGSKDAALRISLPPGAYTVQLSGVGGVTGDGLVELYELQ